MKILFTLLFILFESIAFSQGNDKPKTKSSIKPNTVTFITIIDSTYATKDGIYLNEYVVNINHEEITRLHGKKVKVSGKVSVIKAIPHDTSGPIQQGRSSDTKYIDRPKIEIINQ